MQCVVQSVFRKRTTIQEGLRQLGNAIGYRQEWNSFKCCKTSRCCIRIPSSGFLDGEG